MTAAELYLAVAVSRSFSSARRRCAAALVLHRAYGWYWKVRIGIAHLERASSRTAVARVAGVSPESAVGRVPDARVSCASFSFWVER